MSQLEFTENLEEPERGRIRSRVLHKPAVSFIKLMYLLNLVFVAGWTVLICFAVMQPQSELVPLPEWVVVALATAGYLASMLVIFSLKFGNLQLLRVGCTYYRMMCLITAAALAIGLHYMTFRKEFLLVVLGFLYGYQKFLMKLKERWPDIEQERWN